MRSIHRIRSRKFITGQNRILIFAIFRGDFAVVLNRVLGRVTHRMLIAMLARKREHQRPNKARQLPEQYYVRRA